MSNRFGGKMTFRASNGYVWSGRGNFTINPARMSVESVTNDDQSLARVGTNKPAIIEINCEDRGLDVEKLMLADDFNWTGVEEFSGVTHLLSSAFLTGDPQINRKNGEMTNFKFEGEKYRRLVA